MSRTFLSLHPYYETGTMLGRKQANMGFMNALFRRDPFDAYHFFVHNPEELKEIWKTIPDAKPLLERDALHAFRRIELEKHLKTTPYSVCHFSGPMTEFSALCHARNTFAPHIFPVTALNHSINYTNHAQTILAHIWQGCTPRDAIGCSSRSSKTIIKAWYNNARTQYNLPQNWHEPRLAIIPLGMPEPELEHNAELRATLRNKLNLHNDTIMLLAFGRINHTDKMDLHPLFCALRRIRQEKPQLKFCLMLAGAMGEHEDFEKQLMELAQKWNFTLAIAKNPSFNLKKQLFAAADIFVSPSDNIQESFGLSLVEAAYASLPTIASDWDGYKDIVVQAETGYLIPTIAPKSTPELDIMARVFYNHEHQLLRNQQTAIHIPKLTEALIKLMLDGMLRKKMGEAARERALRLYSFDNIINQWIEFWQELENTPISAEDEKIYRDAKHPLFFNFGEAFSCYASNFIDSNNEIQCTELGLALLERRAPWSNHALVGPNLNIDFAVFILKHCQTLSNISILLNKIEQSTFNYNDEQIQAHLHWLIKHDMLEYTI